MCEDGRCGEPIAFCLGINCYDETNDTAMASERDGIYDRETPIECDGDGNQIEPRFSDDGFASDGARK